MVTLQQMREAAAAFGKQGGKKRASNMTPEQRSNAARKAVEARWARIDKSMTKTEKILDGLVAKNRNRKRKAR